MRRHRRWPYILVVLVLLVGVLLFAANAVTQSAAQAAISKRIVTTTHAARASTTITSFPLVYDVAARGHIKGITMTAFDVPIGPLVVDSISLHAEGIDVDRQQLLTSHKVMITSVAAATVTIDVTNSLLDGAISSASSLPGFKVAVSGGHELVVDVLGHRVYSLDLTRTPIVPPCNLALQDIQGGYSFSCRVAPVPKSLIDAISTAG